MKVSAFFAAALLVASVSAQADQHGADHSKTTTSTTTAPTAATAPAAPTAKKAAKGAKTTTTKTTTASADHKDCSTLTGAEKTTCEAHEAASHKGETHAH